jgi:hypothetical protein
MSKAEERSDAKSDAKSIHAPPAAVAWSGLVWPDFVLLWARVTVVTSLTGVSYARQADWCVLCAPS